MTLGDLINTLKKADPSQVVPLGFNAPHSYRGYYEDVAFFPAYNVTIRTMLDSAYGALNKTFAGYKGGEFTMHEYTTVWLAEYGHEGEGIGPILLRYMLGEFRWKEVSDERE